MMVGNDLTSFWVSIILPKVKSAPTIFFHSSRNDFWMPSSSISSGTPESKIVPPFLALNLTASKLSFFRACPSLKGTTLCPPPFRK